MKPSLLAAGMAAMILISAGCRQDKAPRTFKAGLAMEEGEEEEMNDPEKDGDQRAMFVRDRVLHEFYALKNPFTGTIPARIREKEFAEARLQPAREYGGISGTQGVDNLNTYTPAGPNNIGGRTRAILFDKRYNGTSNKVIIGGSVSGGIFRSADGGQSWTRVNPENDIHNLSALAQDPNSPDIWYAGGGETIANSASGDGAAYLGFGVWKSTDNGLTWNKLPLKVTNLAGTGDVTGSTGSTLESFDNPFDFVHKIYVNPVNSDVYVCGHRRLVRSTDKGASWREVFTTITPSTSDEGQMDIVGTSTGKLYLAVNGGLPDAALRGIWVSGSGNPNTWARIAGGNTLGTDSVDGWRGNDYTGNSKRILMALAPSNQNILYVTYQNGEDATGSSAKPEADLYKYDASGNTWTNLSANVPDFPGQLDGVDPFNVQTGYNLMIAVKPNDENTVFLGGVNLFRSTNGFSDPAGTTWIGGYGKSFTTLNIYGSKTSTDQSKWSHPDMHLLVFDPSNSSRAIAANDGGIQITDNIMATSTTDEPVQWTTLPNYQTLQYYHVAIDPGSGDMNFMGGAQDNGVRFRDGSNLFGDGANNNNHFRLVGGDGGQVALSKTSSSSKYVYGSYQYGAFYRIKYSSSSPDLQYIKPNGLTATPGLTDGYGDFVTYFKKDFNNEDDLYYVNFNRLFRTTSATTVSSSSGWTELTGVSGKIPTTHQQQVNGQNFTVRTNINALELSRGAYATSHVLYIGTNQGKVYRLNNPRSNTATTQPVDITPPYLNTLAGNLTPASISAIASNPNNDEEIMVVVSNYGVNSIWWTNNAKSATPTWRNAEGNLDLPSIRSCAITVKKDAGNNSVTEYYVGTSVGLYSAVDLNNSLPGGGTAAWVREGGNVLNYAVVVSLDYRPEDNILLLGTHGNGMYYAQVGTPDFRPNQNTGINDPVRNDKNFIQQALPTVAVKDVIRYRIGNMFTVRALRIQVHNLAGQLLIRKEAGYQDGELNVQRLSPGAYILSITSEDYKQQFVKKFIKD